MAVDNANRARLEQGGLHIYLSDHRAGAAAGLARARSTARRNAGTAFGRAMDELVEQLESDARNLDRLAEELSVRESSWKRAFALLGERAGRLKPNGRLVRPSPLTRLIEIELLRAGIDAKRSLWRAIAAACGAQVHSVDLDELVRRADEQRATLRGFHADAARAALAGDDPR